MNSLCRFVRSILTCGMILLVLVVVRIQSPDMVMLCGGGGVNDLLKLNIFLVVELILVYGEEIGWMLIFSPWF